MKVYPYEHTMKKNGALSIKNLPFNVGEKIEVIIIHRSKSKTDKNNIHFGENQLSTLTQLTLLQMQIGRYINDCNGYTYLDLVNSQ